MKKTAKWIAAIAAAVLVINWIFVGLELLDGNYDITAGAYIELIALAAFVVCILYIKLTDRCSNCGKIKLSVGKYCPFCGKEIE